MGKIKLEFAEIPLKKSSYYRRKFKTSCRNLDHFRINSKTAKLTLQGICSFPKVFNLRWNAGFSDVVQIENGKMCKENGIYYTMNKKSKKPFARKST